MNLIIEDGIVFLEFLLKYYPEKLCLQNNLKFNLLFFPLLSLYVPTLKRNFLTWVVCKIIKP